MPNFNVTYKGTNDGVLAVEEIEAFDFRTASAIVKEKLNKTSFEIFKNYPNKTQGYEIVLTNHIAKAIVTPSN